MSMIVDNKVVEMRFDNKDFEKNAKTTMSTIDKLKSKLSFGDSQKNTEKFVNAFNKIDFGKISAGVENLEKRFSTFGIVGMRVIQNLTDSAMNFVKSTWSKMTSSISEGGKNRAMNIENARFQLQGLLKEDEKVEAVMSDVDDAVTGTAYSYDAAATAASQFAASGIQAGTQMKTALKGITGVAAMTNSSFEDIANIFTTISGNGKLMGDQLNQLASRGMNAASTLTEYFNGVNNGTIQTDANIKKTIKEITKGTKITEQELRKFVSNGQISFDLFSRAMFDTFGEHAKKANETFNGSLSNMKSALARIGAEFYAPLIKQNGPLVAMFNALRIRINEIKKNIIPFAETVTGALSKVFYNFSKWISNFDIQPYVDGLYNLTGVFKNISRVVLPILKAIKEEAGIHLAFHNIGNSLKKINEMTRGLYLTQNAIEDFKDKISPIGYLFEELYYKAKEIATVLGGSLKKAIQEFFPKDMLGKITAVVEKIRDFIDGISISAKTADNLKDSFKGLFAFFDIIRQVIFSLAGPTAKAAIKIVKIFINIAGAIGRVVVALDEYLRKNDTFNRVVKGTADVFKAIGGAINVVYTKINAFVKSVSGKTISEIFDAIGKSVKDSFKALGDILSGGSITKAFETVADKVRSAFGIVKDSTEGFGKIDTSGVESFGSKLKRLFKPIGVLFEIIRKLVMGLWNFVKKLGPVIKDVLTNVKNVFSELFGGIIETLKNSDSTDILNYVKSGALMVITSRISTFLGKLSKSIKTNASSIGGLKSLVKSASDFVASIKTVMDGVKTTLTMWQKEIQANIIVKIAIAIGILTASLLVLSSIDPNKLSTALGMITVGFAELIGATKLLISGLGQPGKTGGILSLSALLISMSASILILASAMRMMANIDKDALDNGIAALTVLLTELVAAVKLLKKNDSDKAVNGLIKLAASIYIMSMAVKKLSKIEPKNLLLGIAALGAMFAAIIIFMRTVKKPEKFGSLAAGLIVMAVAMNMFAGVLKRFGKIGIEKVAVGLVGFAGVLTLITASLSVLSLNNNGILKVSFALTQFAIAMTIIGAAFKIFSSGDIEKTAVGLAAFATVMTLIILTTQILQQNTQGMIKIAGGLIIFGDALLLISAAFKIFSSGGLENTAAGLAAFAGSIAVIILAVQSLQSDTNGLFKISENLLIMALAITIIGSTIKKFANLGMEGVAVGLVGFAGSMYILVKSLKEMAKIDPIRLDDISWSMFILSDAMLYVGEALGEFAKLSLKQTITGLIGFAVSMQIVIKTVRELDSEAGSVMKLGAGLIVLGIALNVIAVAMKIFGSMSLLSIVGALTMLAGTFLLIGVSAKLLNTSAIYILKLAKALITLGIGVLGIGAGMFLLATSLVTVAAAGGAALVALLGVIKGIVGLLPFLGEKFVEMLEVMIIKLKDILPALGEFLKELIHVGLEVISSALADIIDVILQLIEDLFAGLDRHAPQILSYVISFLFKMIDVLSRESAKIVDKLFNLAMDLIEGLGKAFKKNSSRLMEVVGDFIVNIVSGAVDMVFGGLSNLIFGNTEGLFIDYMDLISEKHRELIDKANEENSAYHELNKEREDGIKKTEEEYQYIKDLRDEYNKLIDSNTGLIKEGYEKRAETILTTLAEATGMELEQIQSLIDGNGKLSASFDEVVRKMETQALISANRSYYEDAIKNRKAAYDSYVELGNEYNDAQNEFNQWMKDNEERLAYIQTIENDTAREAAMKLYNAEKNKAAAAVASLKGAYRTAEETYVGYEQIIENHQNLLYEVQNGTADTIEKATDRVQYSLISAEKGTERTLKNQVETIRKRRDEAAKAYEAGWTNVTKEDIDKWNELLGIAEGEMVKYSMTHEKGAKATYDKVVDVTSKGGEEVAEATAENVEAVEEELDDMPIAGMTTGNETVDNLVSSFAKGEGDVTKATGELSDAAIDGLKDLPDKMYKKGADSVDGLNKGIASKSGFTKEEAEIVAKRYQAMYDKTMDQHSPSKVMYKKGQYTMIGLINGLSSLKEKVSNAAKDVAKTAIDSLASSLTGISDVLSEDIEMNPTITPVLDLSEVTAGVNTMNDLLNSRKTIDLAERANFISNSSQDSKSNTPLTVNNGDIVNVLNNLRNDVNDMKSKVGNLQVVMDTGALVGQIARPVDNILGKWAMNKRRGV